LLPLQVGQVILYPRELLVLGKAALEPETGVVTVVLITTVKAAVPADIQAMAEARHFTVPQVAQVQAVRAEVAVLVHMKMTIFPLITYTLLAPVAAAVVWVY